MREFERSVAERLQPFTIFIELLLRNGAQKAKGLVWRWRGMAQWIDAVDGIFEEEAHAAVAAGVLTPRALFDEIVSESRGHGSRVIGSSPAMAVLTVQGRSATGDHAVAAPAANDTCAHSRGWGRR